MMDWLTLPVAPSLITWIQTGTVVRNFALPLPLALSGIASYVALRLGSFVTGSAVRAPLGAAANDPRLSKTPAPAASQPEHTSADGAWWPAVAGTAVTASAARIPVASTINCFILSPLSRSAKNHCMNAGLVLRPWS